MGCKPSVVLDSGIPCRNDSTDPGERLHENDGSGRFMEVFMGGGAAGSELGKGESVVTADYDEDGFMDLLVTNGRTFETSPFGHGPRQLFHNLGNDNHWIELDLEGVLSNRDGIGAKVFATAGRRDAIARTGRRDASFLSKL